MKSIDDYSDDELQRLLAKTVNTIGGRDRAEAIQRVLDARGVKDSRRSLFPSLDNDEADDDRAED